MTQIFLPQKAQRKRKGRKPYSAIRQYDGAIENPRKSVKSASSAF